MRAIVSKGPQAELEMVEVTPPVAGAGEVVVEARAIGVGRVDLIMRQVMPTDFIPGIEVSGIVTSTGPDVDPNLVGQRVFARVQAGGYSEQVVTRAATIVALPDDLSFEAGVAAGVNALVAHFCVTRTQVAAGETVVVRGAQGGIGHLAVQMASALGATVIEGLKSMPPVPADVVIDLVAGPDTGTHIEQLRPNGRYIMAGISAGVPPTDFASSLLGDFRRSRSISTLSLDTVTDIDLNIAADKVFADVAAGRTSPLIAHKLVLQQANEALHLLASGGVQGKIVIVP